jgi:hypothetical protein
MKKTIALGILTMGAASAAVAGGDPPAAPTVKVGDTWVYRDTAEKGPNGWNQTRDEVTVSRVTSSSIYFSTKPTGSSQAPKESFSGLDWSRARDIDGKETVVNRPLQFPLAVGKAWELEYTEQHPNKKFKFEQWQQKYKVIGFETVTVPAGKFEAIKIEEEGHWSGQLEPGQSVAQGAQVTPESTTLTTQTEKARTEPVSGRTYKAFWYVPEYKRWVKSVEEYYSSGGVRNERYTTELESFKPGE